MDKFDLIKRLKEEKIAIFDYDVQHTGERKRQPPMSITGKAKTLGDIISPITDENDWTCLK